MSPNNSTLQTTSVFHRRPQLGTWQAPIIRSSSQVVASKHKTTITMVVIIIHLHRQRRQPWPISHSSSSIPNNRHRTATPRPSSRLPVLLRRSQITAVPPILTTSNIHHHPIFRSNHTCKMATQTQPLTPVTPCNHSSRWGRHRSNNSSRIISRAAARNRSKMNLCA